MDHLAYILLVIIALQALERFFTTRELARRDETLFEETRRIAVEREGTERAMYAVGVLVDTDAHMPVDTTDFVS